MVNGKGGFKQQQQSSGTTKKTVRVHLKQLSTAQPFRSSEATRRDDRPIAIWNPGGMHIGAEPEAPAAAFLDAASLASFEHVPKGTRVWLKHLECLWLMLVASL